MNFLASLGIAPQNAFPQNFLLDRNIIDKIISFSQVSSGDPVLEIGPGPGSLTEALLEKRGARICSGKRLDLRHALKRLQVEGRFLTVFCEDILKLALENLTPSRGAK